ncbi:hypothetical protein QFC22_006149 [Naganishia vaughanmartiniae]|uniref:Uncharacterized protein n=1 Tax=Naganishia vaughanmartiniae TaxID=1424756 RepID=A0ACC2WNL2_9TREE|nr:hypothetical protein QFC22_006149 [Naganishia vaughanmartiniae]
MVYLYPHPIPVFADPDPQADGEAREVEVQTQNGAVGENEETYAESSTQARKRQQQEQDQQSQPNREAEISNKRRRTTATHPCKITTAGTIALLLPSSTIRNSWELIASQWGKGEVPDVTGLGREYWQDVHVEEVESKEGDEVTRIGEQQQQPDEKVEEKEKEAVNGIEMTPATTTGATNMDDTPCLEEEEEKQPATEKEEKVRGADVGGKTNGEPDDSKAEKKAEANVQQLQGAKDEKAGEVDIEEGEIAETPPAIPGLRSPSLKHIVVATSPSPSTPLSPTPATQLGSLPLPPPPAAVQQQQVDTPVNDPSLSPVLTSAHYAPKVIALAKKIAASRGVKLLLDSGVVEQEREKLARQKQSRRRGDVDDLGAQQIEGSVPRKTQVVKIEEPVDLLDSTPSTPVTATMNGVPPSESGFTNAGDGDDDEEGGGESGTHSQSGTPYASRFPNNIESETPDRETPPTGYNHNHTPGPPGSPTSSLSGLAGGKQRGTKSKGRGTGRWAGHWAAKAAVAAARAERLAAVAEQKARTTAEQQRLGSVVGSGGVGVGATNGQEVGGADGEIKKREVALALGSSSWWNHLLIEARKARGPQWDENTEMYQVDRGSALYYQSTRSPPKTPPPAPPEPLPNVEPIPVETNASRRPTMTTAGNDAPPAVRDVPAALDHSPVLQMAGMAGGIGRPGSSGTGTMGPPPPPMMMGMGHNMHHPTPPITHAAAAVLGIQQHAAPSPSDILASRRSLSGRTSATPVMLNALGLPEPSPGGASVHSLSHGPSMGPPPLGQSQGMSVSPMMMTNRQVPTSRSVHAGMSNGPSMGYPMQSVAGSGMYGQQQGMDAGIPMGMAMPHRSSFGSASGQAVQDLRASQPPGGISMSPVLLSGGSQVPNLGSGIGMGGDGMVISGPQQGTPTPEQHAILQARLQQQHILQRQALAAAQQGQVTQHQGGGGGFGSMMPAQGQERQGGMDGINQLSQSQPAGSGAFPMQQGSAAGGMTYQQQQIAAFLRQQGMNMNPQQMAALINAQQQQQQRSQQSQNHNQGQAQGQGQSQGPGNNAMFTAGAGPGPGGMTQEQARQLMGMQAAIHQQRMMQRQQQQNQQGGAMQGGGMSQAGGAGMQQGQGAQGQQGMNPALMAQFLQNQQRQQARDQ